MRVLTVALLLALLALTLAVRQPRPPVSACEARLARLLPVPFEGLGAIPEPMTEEEFNASFDATTGE